MPLPPEHDARTADLVVDMSRDGTFFDRWDMKTSLGPRAFGNPPDCNDPAHCMTDTFRRAVIPSANMHANARGARPPLRRARERRERTGPRARARVASSTSSDAATCAATTW